jgi:N-glycosylase/DNA lyase
MQITIPLRGGGGEPVDLARTLNSHGLLTLSPNRLEEGARADTLVLPVLLAGGRATVMRIGPGPRGFVKVEASGSLRGKSIERELTAIVRRVLHLDADYSGFYERAARDPELAWVTRGAGRFVRSPGAFEDAIKTIATTNCTWSATIRMVEALVGHLGSPVAGAPHGRLFPTARQMLDAPVAWYRDVARAGYRGAYMRAVAGLVADGKVDFDAWAAASPEVLPDDELEARLRALPGIGPYAAAHIMMLMGRYSRLVIDSSTRPKYVRLSGKRPRSDAAIVKRFAPYGKFAGLAFWCYVTRDWLDDRPQP